MSQVGGNIHGRDDVKDMKRIIWRRAVFQPFFTRSWRGHVLGSAANILLVTGQKFVNSFIICLQSKFNCNVYEVQCEFWDLTKSAQVCTAIYMTPLIQKAQAVV